jgi:hypothetical protein
MKMMREKLENKISNTDFSLIGTRGVKESSQGNKVLRYKNIAKEKKDH